MGNPAGVRRDLAALEQRRMEAARLLKEGLSQSEVARELGVHRQSVSRWARELEQSGVRGLRKAKHTGRTASSARPSCAILSVRLSAVPKRSDLSPGCGPRAACVTSSQSGPACATTRTTVPRQLFLPIPTI